ncbi:hypothetical protein V6Z12_A11G119500 [Gossypium hirsutum]
MLFNSFCAKSSLIWAYSPSSFRVQMGKAWVRSQLARY